MFVSLIKIDIDMLTKDLIMAQKKFDVRYDPFTVNRQKGAPVLATDVDGDIAEKIRDDIRYKKRPQDCCFRHAYSFEWELAEPNPSNKIIKRFIDVHICFNPPKCGCFASGAIDKEQVHACANALKSGKCRDEFVRNVIGMALFPQIYEKQK